MDFMRIHLPMLPNQYKTTCCTSVMKIKALTTNIIKLGQWHFITLPTCDIDYKFTVDKYSRPKNQNYMTTVPLLCTVLPFTLSSNSQKKKNRRNLLVMPKITLDKDYFK